MDWYSQQTYPLFSLCELKTQGLAIAKNLDLLGRFLAQRRSDGNRLLIFSAFNSLDGQLLFPGRGFSVVSVDTRQVEARRAASLAHGLEFAVADNRKTGGCLGAKRDDRLEIDRAHRQGSEATDCGYQGASQASRLRVRTSWRRECIYVRRAAWRLAQSGSSREKKNGLGDRDGQSLGRSLRQLRKSAPSLRQSQHPYV